MGELPREAIVVLGALGAAGHEAWVVGGWVRDALRGTESHDVDITTRARCQEVQDVLGVAGIVVHDTGSAHGTVTAVVDGVAVEITTYRVEGSYSDRRHPDEVRFVSDVREDLARRDFTINAMAYHPDRGLLDPFGGREDLAAGVIRCVGNPAERFTEDALRVLRAVRFACRMGFVVEPATQAALDASAPLLADIAQERIGQEISGILASGRAGWALMHERAAISAALPELAPLFGFDQHSRYHIYDVAEHTAHVVMALEALLGGVVLPELHWAALLHDVAKPDCFTLDAVGRGHFFGHPEVGAHKAAALMRRLAIPQAIVRPTTTLIRYHDRMITPKPSSVRKALALLEHTCPGNTPFLCHELLGLKRADALGKGKEFADYTHVLDEVEQVLRDQVAQGAVWRQADLAVTGGDIVSELGIAPGPNIGLVLEELLKQVVSGGLPNERSVLLRVGANYARRLR